MVGGIERMTLPLLRLFTALASALVAAACLVALEFIIAATSGNFLDLLWHSAWFIVGISTFAGVVRLLFRRSGFVLSTACGALVASIGFIVCLFIAIRGI